MSDSKRIEDGGPAFARSAAEHGHGGHYEQDGMSLRDWFAGKVIGSVDWSNADISALTDDELRMMADQVFRIADAMIVARRAALSTEGV